MKLMESWSEVRERLDPITTDPDIEAEMIIRHVMGLDRTGFFKNLMSKMVSAQFATVNQYVSRRIYGEPLAYILGYREFYGLQFYVNPDVLIPRQETEVLVDSAIELVSDDRQIRLVDVGTGSGAIAIALSKHLPNVCAYAIDISRKALRVADINRRKHGVEDRVHLFRGDILSPIENLADVIVSNPPYLSTREINGIAVEVANEPRCAISGGLDGLKIIRRLFGQAPFMLKKGGRMLVEISPQQVSQGLCLARNAFPTANVRCVTDLQQMPRVIIIET